MGNSHKAIQSLSRIIDEDKKYYIKIDQDKTFDVIRTEINKFFLKQFQAKKQIALNIINKIKETLEKIKEICFEARDKIHFSSGAKNMDDIDELIIRLEKKLLGIQKVTQRESIIDIIDAIDSLVVLNKKLKENIFTIKSKLEYEYNYAKKSICSVKSNIKHNKDSTKRLFVQVLTKSPFFFIPALIGYYVDASAANPDGQSKYWGLFWGVLLFVIAYYNSNKEFFKFKETPYDVKDMIDKCNSDELLLKKLLIECDRL